MSDNQVNAAVGTLAIGARNVQEPPTMAKLILAGLYYLKTLSFLRAFLLVNTNLKTGSQLMLFCHKQIFVPS